MIIEFVLSVVAGFVKAVFGILPNIPPMPAWVDTSLDTVIDVVIGGVGLVSYLYSPQIFIFVLTTSLVVLNFEHVYHAAMWVIRKLPIGVQ